MTDATLLRALRHNTWANLELITFCARLSAEQLEWAVPGTYGSIHRTLHHIVGAEHGYLLALTGELPRIEAERGGRAMTPDWCAPLEELVERERSNGDRIERVLGSDGFEPERVITRRRGGTATAAVIVAQFIHHGSDHRAHVGTILGAHGVEPPNLDVWAHGLELGLVTRP